MYHAERWPLTHVVIQTHRDRSTMEQHDCHPGMIPCMELPYSTADFNYAMSVGDREAWCKAWLALEVNDGTGLDRARHQEVAETYAAYKTIDLPRAQDFPALRGQRAVCSADPTAWEDLFSPLTLAECGGGGDCGYFVLNRIQSGRRGDAARSWSVQRRSRSDPPHKP